MTPNIVQLHRDKELREEFLSRASLYSDQPLAFIDAYRFVTSLQHGTTVKDLCLRFKIPTGLKMDPKPAIQFLVLKGLLR